MSGLQIRGVANLFGGVRPASNRKGAEGLLPKERQHFLFKLELALKNNFLLQLDASAGAESTEHFAIHAAHSWRRTQRETAIFNLICYKTFCQA